MTGYKFGDLVLVPFPFTDQLAVKRRPAVVISSPAYHQARPDLLIMAVTSQQPLILSVGEVQAQDWQGAGLLKPEGYGGKSSTSGVVKYGVSRVQVVMRF